MDPAGTVFGAEPGRRCSGFPPVDCVTVSVDLDRAYWLGLDARVWLEVPDGVLGHAFGRAGQQELAISVMDATVRL